METRIGLCGRDWRRLGGFGRDLGTYAHCLAGRKPWVLCWTGRGGRIEGSGRGRIGRSGGLEKGRVASERDSSGAGGRMEGFGVIARFLRGT